MQLPFNIETELEAAICADPEWQAGVVWGKPRPGHSEGKVMYHIADVLANIDRQATSDNERRALRLVALVHDTFKYRVDTTKPSSGSNHHAAIARTFAKRYLDDPTLLDIIELHDEAFNSWRSGVSKKDWKKAEQRAERLIARLDGALPLYLRFFRADNQTDSKDQAPLLWFEQLLYDKGLEVP